jgi:hypothetical protein
MRAPGEDPEAVESRSTAARRRGRVESDSVCPWCGSTELRTHKKIISPKGFGIIAYIFFPFALLYWLSSTTYNVCQKCEARWQRGVPMTRRTTDERDGAAPPSEPEVRAGMYAEQVPAAALVRRRPRLGAAAPVAPPSGDVELRAAPGACRLCRQAAGRYDARDAPAVPIVGCTCEGGCTCEVVPAED